NGRNPSPCDRESGHFNWNLARDKFPECPVAAPCRYPMPPVLDVHDSSLTLDLVHELQRPVDGIQIFKEIAGDHISLVGLAMQIGAAREKLAKGKQQLEVGLQARDPSTRRFYIGTVVARALK